MTQARKDESVRSENFRSEIQREKEPPAHRLRREVNRAILDYVGPVDEDALEDGDDDVPKFEKFKRKKH